MDNTTTSIAQKGQVMVQAAFIWYDSVEQGKVNVNSTALNPVCPHCHHDNTVQTGVRIVCGCGYTWFDHRLVRFGKSMLVAGVASEIETWDFLRTESGERRVVAKRNKNNMVLLRFEDGGGAILRTDHPVELVKSAKGSQCQSLN